VERVQGIGGIFFKSPDPEGLRWWYSRYLGIKPEEWGGSAMFTNAGQKTLGTRSGPSFRLKLNTFLQVKQLL